MRLAYPPLDGMPKPTAVRAARKENPGSQVGWLPGFFLVVDMFDCWLVGLAAFDQHDEGYHYERCSRCGCGGDHGERLVTGACEVLG